MNLLIITGMPGSGKSEAANAFSKAGIPVIVMGDIIREEVKKKGLVANSSNTMRVMLEMRTIYGSDVVAIRCARKLENLDSEPIVVIEGCKSQIEINAFKFYAEKITSLCVHASPATRFNRLRQRERDDDPLDWIIFAERDRQELSVGLGDIIALSNIMLVNEDSIDELHAKLAIIVGGQ